MPDQTSKGYSMQSKKIAPAERPAEGPSPGELLLGSRTTFDSCARRAARRLEIDRDHRLVTRGLVREVSRFLLADQTDSHPEMLFERLAAALKTSRADCQRLNDTRISLRGQRSARFEDSVALPADLVVYGHRGNYHGVHASMHGLGSLLRPLVARPDGAVERVTAVSLAEELHRRCEIWTLELGGAVHVFAKPGSEADKLLAGAATRIPRVPARALQTPLTVV
jgi:hypothetical protein